MLFNRNLCVHARVHSSIGHDISSSHHSIGGHSKGIKVNIQANRSSVHVTRSIEGKVNDTDFLWSPAWWSSDLLKLDFWVIDFDWAGDSWSWGTAAFHWAGDFKEVFRGDQFTLGSRVQDFVVVLQTEQVLLPVKSLDSREVNVLERRKVNSNEVAITGTSSWDTSKGSGDLGAGLGLFLALGLHGDLLLEGESDAAVGNLTLSVIELHNNLSSFAWSVVVLLELGSEGIGTLTRTASSEVGLDFVTDSLHGALDWLSNDEGLLVFKLWASLQGWLEDSFDLITDICEEFMAFLMIGTWEGLWKHEGKRNGVLSWEEDGPGVHWDSHLDDFVLFVKEFVDIDVLGDLHAVLCDRLELGFGLEERGIFNSL